LQKAFIGQNCVKIAVIEDNVSMAKGIAYVLRDAGHAVDLLYDGDNADTFLRRDDSDIIVLDINLPGMSGIDILIGLRARDDMRPVILLSAYSDAADRVRGLDAGADDYLGKPFDMTELQARIRALSRRRSKTAIYRQTLGSLEFDTTSRQITVGEQTVALPRRELALFEILIRSLGRSVSKGSIVSLLYGTGEDVDERVVEVYISRLRKRLAPYGVGIRVRRGLGYEMFEI
jgi:two-component system OmpR family response regulator